jgi:hypothetical protein
MAKSNGSRARRGKPPEPALSRITVAGFKSIGPERSIEIRPLTLLAGANSSGKTSIMQPLLLLKQTLEAPYDPGALLLDGPNVRFTSFEQMLFRSGKHSSDECFSVGLGVEDQVSVNVRFCRERGRPIDVQSMTVETQQGLFELREGDFDFDPKTWSSDAFGEVAKALGQQGYGVKTQVVRHRCLLGKYLVKVDKSGEETRALGEGFAHSIGQVLGDMIHLPGLRGNPVRTYPVSAAGPRFIGTFENYVASIIAKAADVDPGLLERIGDDLRALGLTWRITATPVNDTQVELRVGRLPQPTRGGSHDLVNIADVGFGVSQTLPVVVALQVARPGQLVYIEQPELHLHPRAQVAMARLLANAANRGVRVVAETHSSLLLLGVQSLVAEGALAPDKVKLHWFQRNSKDGSTDIASADLDQSGAYGDWPMDFFDVSMDASLRYTQAAFEQLKNGSHGQTSPAPPRH